MEAILFHSIKINIWLLMILFFIVSEIVRRYGQIEGNARAAGKLRKFLRYLGWHKSEINSIVKDFKDYDPDKNEIISKQ